MAAADDADAFAAFYRRHAARLLAWCVRRTGDPEVAADVVAEAFAAALEGCGRYTPAKGPAAGWLYGIARHQIAQHARRGAVERRALRRLGIDRPALDDAEIARVLALAELEGLPQDQRAAVSARVVDGDDYAAIAAAARTSEATVRQRVSRGLATLRRDHQGARPLDGRQGPDPLRSARGQTPVPDGDERT